jgi:hypothetical protein
VDAPISEPAVEPIVQQTAEPAAVFSYEDAAVTLPSPGAVYLDSRSRLGARYEGNIDYLRYIHERYGEEMLEAYDVRHYAPNTFL